MKLHVYLAIGLVAALMGCTGDRRSGGVSDAVLDGDAGDAGADTTVADTNTGDTTTCVPQCMGKTCGDDGCGGRCQPGCLGNSFCNEDTAQCVCIPSCANKNCGSDGCSANCGVCSDGQQCGATGVCETPTLDCSAEADGTACGDTEGQICLSGACVASTCGDGFVDASRGEVCDDGNTAAGDGCEPTCDWTCTDESGCAALDDGDPCDGTATCDATTHTCVVSDPLTVGADCAVTTGAGVCRQGTGRLVCQPAACGNAFVDAGEECDDGNTDPGDGCEADCTYTCTTDNVLEKCDDGNPCNGAEVCGTDHKCAAGTALSCDDGYSCTNDSCNANVSGDPCEHTLIDGDLDGFASGTHGTCGPGNAWGGDCNDSNNAVNPGVPESCTADGVDNNCNNQVDEGAQQWWADCDGDGYALATAKVVQACAQPALSETGCTGNSAKWTTRNPATNPDCCDLSNKAYPGSTNWSTAKLPSGCPAGGGFDYNCDGSATKRWPSTIGRACVLDVTIGCVPSPSTSGWYNSVPACGVPGNWLTNCHWTNVLTGCVYDGSGKIQECR